MTVWIFSKHSIRRSAPDSLSASRNILEKFSSDIELKEKARNLYTEFKTHDEKMNRLINDLERQGFIELENELDETYKVTAAFHYIEELIDCLTIIETEQV